MKELFYDILRPLEERVERFAWENPAAYREFLAQTYFYVSHSTRLLASAAGRFPTQSEKLFNRFTAHISEERAHEVLARRDLEALGGRISDYEERATTAALYRTQYDSIEREDPVAILGYILALEGIAVTKMKEVHDRLVKVYPKSATTFIGLHAQEDPHHLEEAFEALDGLSEKQLGLIVRNLKWSASLYGAMLDCAESAAKLT